ncbi:HD domain-containing protein [Candidatus Woesearchaeota archaeon]|nr:HD domain-containing protein [Candidatus Woesearchaeota archaeon]
MNGLSEVHIELIRDYVSKNQANSPLYTLKHVFPAAKIGVEMAKKLEADSLIVEAGLLLHDIGYHKDYKSKERDHIFRGIDISLALLSDLGIHKLVRDRIIDTIRTHDGRLESSSPIENFVVNDADQVAVFTELPWMYQLMRDAFGMSHERALMGCVQESWKSYHKIIAMDSTRVRFEQDYELTKKWLRTQVQRVNVDALRDNPPKENVEEAYKFLDELLK